MEGLRLHSALCAGTLGMMVGANMGMEAARQIFQLLYADTVVADEFKELNAELSKISSDKKLSLKNKEKLINEHIDKFRKTQPKAKTAAIVMGIMDKIGLYAGAATGSVGAFLLAKKVMKI